MELYDKSRRNKLKSNTQRTTISNKKEDILKLPSKESGRAGVLMSQDSPLTAKL